MSYSCLIWILIFFAAIPLHKTIFLKGKCDTSALNLYVVSDLQSLTDLKITHIKQFIDYFMAKREGHLDDFNINIYDPYVNKTLINIGQKVTKSEIIEAVDELRKVTSKSEFVEKTHQHFLQAIDNTIDHVKLALGDFILTWFVGCSYNCEETLTTFDELATSFREKQLLSFMYESTPEDFRNITYNEYYINIPIDIRSPNEVDIKQILNSSICSQCPDGWFPYHNEKGKRSSCYFFKEKNTLMNESVEECKLKNSRLPSVETNDEMRFIEKLFSNENPKFDVTNTITREAFVGLMRHRHSSGTSLRWITLRPFIISCDITGYRNIINNIFGFTLSLPFNESENKTMTSDACTITVQSRAKTANVILCEQETEDECSNKINSFQKIEEEHVQQIFTEDKFMERDNQFLAKMKFDKYEVFAEPFFNLLFDCGDDFTLLPYNLVCDGEVDCDNNKDEEYCYHYSPGQKQSLFFCTNPNRNENFPAKHTIPIGDMCNGIRNCPDNSDEMHCQECMDATCEDGTCVPKNWLSRDREVCLPYNANSLFYLDVSVHNVTLFADEESMHEVVRCGASTNKSLVSQDWAPKCIFLRGRDKNPMGCLDKEHLTDCDTFRCPYGYLKCPHSFCIPVHFFNDGIQDCPYGEDEPEYFSCTDSNISLHTINGEDKISEFIFPPNYFACKDSYIILHPINVCDGIAQCPRGDEEIICNGTCPLGFNCMAGAVSVDQFNKKEIYSLNIFDINTKFLNLSYLNLSVVNIPYILPNLLSFHAAFSGLVTIDNLFVNNTFLYFVDSLNFSGNEIRNINKGLLQFVPNLRVLDLSRNMALIVLDYESISSKKLQVLDLSNTLIAKLDLSIFQIKPTSLRHLNLQGTRITKVGFIQRLDFFDIRNTNFTEESVFNLLKNITISSDLFTDNFKYCCPQVMGKGIPKHTCHAPDDPFSTCSDLMGDSFKRSLLWTIAVISLVGNFGVIVYRLLSDKAAFKTGYWFFVLNLAIADLLMAIYLVTIASMDALYRGNYVIYEKAWRESLVCTVAGVISTMSNESSILFVLLITLDRLLVIRFPYGNYRLTKPTIIAAVVTAWLLSCGLSLTPAFFPHWGMYSSNAICMGLPNDTRNDGMLFGITVYIGFNCLLFVLITAGQIVIFHSLFANKTMTHKSTARRVQDLKVARQLFLVAISNFIFWFPLCVVGVLAITGTTVSNEIFSWLILFILPVNSATNPLIYTAPALHAKWMAFKLRAADTGIELKEIRKPVEQKDKPSVIDKAPSGGVEVVSN